jgi:hypothetical protein
MAFRPDILVTTPDEPRAALVVEATVQLSDLDRTEQQLKEYMVSMQCPVGLLVTPERIHLYRDLYTDRSPRSVQRIGEYDAAPLWAHRPPEDPVRFEGFVQDWLERLTDQPTRHLPRELGEALREYVLPALSQGEVRAAGPRWPNKS